MTVRQSINSLNILCHDDLQNKEKNDRAKVKYQNIFRREDI